MKVTMTNRGNRQSSVPAEGVVTTSSNHEEEVAVDMHRAIAERGADMAEEMGMVGEGIVAVVPRDVEGGEGEGSPMVAELKSPSTVRLWPL